MLGGRLPVQLQQHLFCEECVRIIRDHPDHSQPLFLYLAFQSVHNPYDQPPIDVDALFPEIVDPTRRIYAGMVKMMDDAVRQVVQAFQKYELWQETVTIFTSDNGGIGPGSNYPLRGTKVYHWEGGIKAVGFVRGTDNPLLKPLRTRNNTTSTALFHVTDWFLTIVEGIAGGNITHSTLKPLPLDGYNQWETLKNESIETNRTTIFHNVPVGAKPVWIGKDDKGRPKYSNSMCMQYVDNRTGPCATFGLTGGAMRHCQWKLLVTHNGTAAPWGDSSRIQSQIPPGGKYSNGTRVFQPSTNDKIPKPYQGTYYLFDIDKDPTESNNLAATLPTVLKSMLKLYNDYAKTAVPALTWRWGFSDPSHSHNPGTQGKMEWRTERSLQSNNDQRTCTGPFLGSQYCAYGHEDECFVMGMEWNGHDADDKSTALNANTTIACQNACAGSDDCKYWILKSNGALCTLKKERGDLQPCGDCAFGPKHCPI